MTGSNDIDAAIARKVRIARAGLYCFICCLMGTMVLFPLGSIMGMIDHRTLSAFGTALMYAGGALFAGTLASFGVLLHGLILQPREHDIRNELKPTASGLILIFAVGTALFVLIVLGTLLAGAITLFLKHREPILAAGAYFIMGGGFFFVAHLYLMARGIITANEYPRWMASLVKKLRADDAAERFSPSADAKIVTARKLLSKAQMVLGTAIGIVFTLLTGASEYTDLLRPVIGSERAERAEQALGSSEIILLFLALFIFVFTSMFIVRTITSIIDFRRDRSMGKLDDTYRAG